MICEYCEKEFTIPSKGTGGKNRALCFDCLPNGLDKSARTSLRRKLLTVKAQKERMDIGCSICGYNKNHAALEWHHTSDDKEVEPANALKRSWKLYKEETAKCILLCANCHRETHNPM